jgi:uncharacterized protein
VQSQLAWYIAGPILGLCVVACRVLFDARLGVTGGFSELVDKARRGRADVDWRGWFVLGTVLGGTVFAVANGGKGFAGYGWLTETFPGGVTVAILIVSGVAVGYGAKTAGGCTSGNGLSGTAALMPSALVATGTFFATGIAVSLVTEALR